VIIELFNRISWIDVIDNYLFDNYPIGEKQILNLIILLLLKNKYK